MIKECWECDHDSYCPSYNDPNITPSNCRWLKKDVQVLGTAWISEKGDV